MALGERLSSEETKMRIVTAYLLPLLGAVSASGLLLGAAIF